MLQRNLVDFGHVQQESRDPFREHQDFLPEARSKQFSTYVTKSSLDS